MLDERAKEDRDNRKHRRDKRQLAERDAQTTQQYAKNGAQEKFSNIRKQMERDIRTYNEDAVFRLVELQAGSSTDFTVVNRSPPKVTVRVILDTTMITCSYELFLKEGSGGKAAKQDSRTLRICSDVSGHLTVYKNGDGTPCADDSDASVYILEPLLDHVDS